MNFPPINGTLFNMPPEIGCNWLWGIKCLGDIFKVLSRNNIKQEW